MNIDCITLNKVRENLKVYNDSALNAGVSLGIPPHKRWIGLTVSIPTRYKIDCIVSTVNSKGKTIKKTLKREFQTLTPYQQYAYYINTYLPRVITPYISSGIVVPELNKEGNIHIHAICYDTDIQTDFDMVNLRKTLFNTMIVLKITKNDIRKHSYLNHVHYIERNREWLEYLDKDTEKMLKLDKFIWSDDQYF